MPGYLRSIGLFFPLLCRLHPPHKLMAKVVAGSAKRDLFLRHSITAFLPDYRLCLLGIQILWMLSLFSTHDIIVRV